MASVKRYDLEYTNEYSPAKKMVVRENGDWIEATDYDKLVDVVRGFLACNHSCTCMRDNQCDFCLMRSKALALIGEGGEETK